jgi:hypothetical protein
MVTSLIVLRRKPETYQDEDYQVFMAMVKQVGYDRRRHRLYKLDEQGKPTDQVDNDLPEIEQKFGSFWSKPMSSVLRSRGAKSYSSRAWMTSAAIAAGMETFTQEAISMIQTLQSC